MTPAEDLAVVRARLERMIALADTVAQHLPYWGGVAERCGDETGSDIGAFIAAASPDLLLRVAREALGVLDRHRQHQIACGHVVTWPVVRFCPEVAAVLRAWKP